jgi:hypothetical protein
MYDCDDILIIGDSFCASRHESDNWPKYLTDKLTGSDVIPRGQGYGGCSWWSTRNRLLKELDQKVPKILIMCHTEPNRIPSDYDFGINFKSVEIDNIWIANEKYRNHYSKDIKDAANMYYEYLHFFDFHHWAQEQWFLELDEILSEKKISIVIHIHCFRNSKIFENGTTSEEDFRSLQITDDSGDVLQYKNDNKIRFDNHFTREQNIKIGEALYKVIQEYDPNDRLKNLNLLG